MEPLMMCRHRLHLSGGHIGTVLGLAMREAGCRTLEGPLCGKHHLSIGFRLISWPSKAGLVAVGVLAGVGLWNNNWPCGTVVGY